MLAFAAQGCGPARDDTSDVSRFYAKNMLHIVVGTAPGGGNDQVARLLANHLGRHIPGAPKIIVQNMPGAGSFVAANHLFNTAPKDGSTIGIFSEPVPFWAVRNARFDPDSIAWIGGISRRNAPVLLLRSDSRGKKNPFSSEHILGATGTADAYGSYARIANDLAGTRFKLLAGYAGTEEILLAIERKEVDGIAGISWEGIQEDRPHWFEGNLARPLFLFTLERDPNLPGVPTIAERVTEAEDFAVLRLLLGTQGFSRTLSAPKGVPQARLDALRAGFKSVVKDAEFAKGARAVLGNEFHYTPPEDIEKFLSEKRAATTEARKRVMEYME
jgi:tripartite-type tricarboxylate transporter receptor subunit TctC